MDNPCGESQARQWTKEAMMMMGHQLRDFCRSIFLCGSNGGYGYEHLLLLPQLIERTLGRRHNRKREHVLEGELYPMFQGEIQHIMQGEHRQVCVLLS